MPSDICGEILMLNPGYESWCANYKIDYILFTKDETISFIKNQIMREEKPFLFLIEQY